MNTVEGQEDRHVVLPFLARHPIAAPSSVAATTSLLLPIVALALKVYVCHYGWATDYSGVCICVPPFVAVAAALGAGVGAITERIAQARAKKTKDAKPLVAWATAGAVVAGILDLATGLIPTFMVLFPEC